MKEFISERKDFAKEDYKYWQERGWINGKRSPEK
jgi:hypothetical protein